MKVVGLTGGIASGKSTVTRMLQEEGIPVIDADIIAREVVEPKSLGLEALVSVFGRDILTEEGELNRKRLGDIVFSDESRRNQVNQILQPIIRKTFIERMKQYQEQQTPIVVLDVPLLYEMHYEEFCDEVIVVYVHQRLQIHRLHKRNGLKKEEAIQRIQSQLSLDEKKKRADIVFDNTQTLESLQKQVKDWLETTKNAILKGNH